MADDIHDPDYLFKTLLEYLPDHVYVKDRDSRFVLLNQASARAQGWTSPEEGVGKSNFDTYSAEAARQITASERRILETGEPLLGVEEHLTSKNGEERWVSSSKIPLRGKEGQPIGTMGISRDITEHKEAELRALHYAREMVAIKEGMEEDIRMAGELQKTFFPSTYPVFPAGASAAASCVEFLHRHLACGGLVSGDLCLIRKLSETSAGIFLSDVMGLGVRAALGTALIRAMVGELEPYALDPGEYLERMNALLLPILRQADIRHSTTACYLVVDVAAGRIRFANAGHPPPLYFDSRRQQVRRLDAGDGQEPPLAAVAGTTYATFSQAIAPGDAVALFTDGLVRVRGAGGEAFGAQRLLACAERNRTAGLDDLFTALVDEARAFANHGIFNDDVCIAGFKLRHVLGEGAAQ
ncbi:SpoIIE family protein phosphatase [Pontiella sp.]|uniref:SpoIIE family protein phosphatase n=1 Tax=Pontiella sp. TaxID=2837462 RepID=UPI0035628553